MISLTFFLLQFKMISFLKVLIVRVSLQGVCWMSVMQKCIVYLHLRLKLLKECVLCTSLYLIKLV